MEAEEKTTISDLKVIIAELALAQKETNQQLNKLCAEITRVTTEIDRQMRESRIDADRRAIDADRRAIDADRRAIDADRRIQETDRQIQETNRKLESFGIVQGEIAEDLFRRNVKTLLEKENIRVNKVITHLKEENSREYDIVAINGEEVVVFEIKNKLRSDDILRFVSVQLPQFKEGFPRFKDFRIYGGIGALVVNKSLEKEARKRGLFVLTQSDDGNAQLQRPPHLCSY